MSWIITIRKLDQPLIRLSQKGSDCAWDSVVEFGDIIAGKDRGAGSSRESDRISRLPGRLRRSGAGGVVL